mmetsp:Transcript_33638/g.103839  ORF Transcript_33638/g.103839 Transcript_33638/m.103839 type:complete len:294 (+) Transcript_33638:235-1116(+)
MTAWLITFCRRRRFAMSAATRCSSDALSRRCSISSITSHRHGASPWALRRCSFIRHLAWARTTADCARRSYRTLRVSRCRLRAATRCAEAWYRSCVCTVLIARSVAGRRAWDRHGCSASTLAVSSAMSEITRTSRGIGFPGPPASSRFMAWRCSAVGSTASTCRKCGLHCPHSNASQRRMADSRSCCTSGSADRTVRCHAAIAPRDARTTGTHRPQRGAVRLTMADTSKCSTDAFVWSTRPAKTRRARLRLYVTPSAMSSATRLRRCATRAGYSRLMKVARRCTSRSTRKCVS